MVELQAVEDDSYISDVFLNIHKILNEEATAVDTPGGEVELVEHTNGNQWIGAFPENYLQEGGDFPVAVIKTPNSSNVLRGWQFDEEFYTFEIHVYANRAEHPAKFISKAWDALKRHESELSGVGLYNLTHGQTTNDMIMRGELKIHEMIMPVTVRRLRC